jgi:hypothetical protein
VNFEQNMFTGRLFYILLLLVLGIFVTCCESSEDRAMREIEAEARDFAEEFWNARSSRCGDSTFLRSTQLNGDEVIFQLKSFFVAVTPVPLPQLSPAEKLNVENKRKVEHVPTVEWQGHFQPVIDFGPGRTFGTPSDSSTSPKTLRQWSEWKDQITGMPRLSIFRVDGTWRFMNETWAESVQQRYTKIGCDEIPL